MGTKTIKYIAIILTTAFFISGCGFIYEKNVNDAYPKLKIGMAKSELDKLFSNVKFLKEQAIVKYPNATERNMRDSFSKDVYYDSLYPKEVFESVTFDGNTKVFSYLIRKQLNWPNGWIIHYIAIFYDKKYDKVIGWAKIRTYGEANTWRDNF